MIVSITITYHPDIASLEGQLRSVRDQVDAMLVVDNGSSTATTQQLHALCLRMGARMHQIGHNSGIAHAQNIGIQQACDLGARWLLLLDQDSEAMPGMVSQLRHALELTPQAAAAGPSSIDSRTGRRSFFMREMGSWPRQWHPSAGDEPGHVEVGFLIASGCLIRRSALDRPDPMRASWFIDHIDSEWCLRVRSLGWILLGVTGAVLKHRLGDKVSRIWLLRWRQVSHHSPLRDYYMFRNSLLLAREAYVTWRWKLYFLSRLVQFAAFFLAFTPRRAERCKMMATGVVDGLRGRTGARP